jgi:hypothetical protein
MRRAAPRALRLALLLALLAAAGAANFAKARHTFFAMRPVAVWKR